MTRDEVHVVLFNLRCEAEAAELVLDEGGWRDAAKALHRMRLSLSEAISELGFDPTKNPPFSGWRTSIGAGGKAHFYVDGKPACGERKGIWPAAKLGELFTRPTRATTSDDHICRYCAKSNPRTCACWRCSMKRMTERARGGHSPQRGGPT